MFPHRRLLTAGRNLVVAACVLGAVIVSLSSVALSSGSTGGVDGGSRADAAVGAQLALVDATPTPVALKPFGVPPHEFEMLPSGGSELGFLSPGDLDLSLPDLDVQYIGRTPRYRWDQSKKWPSAGETVTFEGHIANRGGSAAGSFVYAWYIDGVQRSQASHPGLVVGAEDVLRLNWNWADGPHTVKLVLDTTGAVAEVSEQNNVIEDRTNALALGIWVEQSFYDFFNENVWQAGWGGNSFDDWIQRHVSIWNEMFAAAVYPLTPNGVVDRVRLDKVVRVPDGALNCNSNRPAEDYEVDLMWGFSSEMVGVPSPANCSWTPRARDDRSVWDRDMGLLHELSHARYLIDLYGFNLDSHEQHLAADVNASDQTLPLVNIVDMPEFRPPAYLIVDGEIAYCRGRSGNSFTNCTRGAQGTRARSHQAGATVFGDQIRIQDGQGNALAGGPGLPAVSGAFHRGADFGVDLMNAGSQYGEHSAYALNRIAGQRPVCGNYNAPCNIGEYLNDIPQSNLIEIRYSDGSPVANALVEVYRAKPYPIWYGKTYEGAPDLVLQTDAQGRANLGASPFGSGGLVHTYGHSNGVLALKIVAGDRVGVEFLEVTAFNLTYWRGNQQQAIHPVTFSHWTTVSATTTPIATNTSTPTSVPGTWQRQSSGTSNWLWPIQLLNVNLGWAGGEGGLVLGTTNGGATWQTLSQSGPTIQDMHFVDDLYGWRVGWGYVGRSTDGGRTWTQEDYGATHNLLGVHFLDRQHGWIVGGEGGWIRRTTDGGQTWSGVQMPSPWAYLQDVYFVDASRGWAVGWGGNILHSTDGGATWQRQSSGTSEILEGVFFVDSQEGWVVGHGGVILHTVDGGGQWVRQNSGTTESLMGVGFANRQVGWAVGGRGTILATTDGGNTWRPEASGVATILQKVSVLDAGHVWTAGEGGWILKRVPDTTPTPTPTNTQTATPTVTPTSTPRLTVVNVTFSPTTLNAGDVLRVDVTVRNIGGGVAETQGPDPGFAYNEGDTFDSRGYPLQVGKWRVGVNFGTGPSPYGAYVYRWGLGSPLPPGQSRSITGYIRLTTPNVQDYWVGIVQEGMAWYDEGSGRTTITVQQGMTNTSTPTATPTPTPTGTPNIANVPDLDALWVERQPRHAWNASKNWPDVGEVVTFTLHVANKGGQSSGPFNVRWRTLDPDGVMVPGSEVVVAHPGLPAHSASITINYAEGGMSKAWADGRWRDGYYQIKVEVDPNNQVAETGFEHNNEIADYTNALSVAFAVEQDVYDWIQGQPTGRMEDVPAWARSRANFYWWSKPADTPPPRAGTYSWEDWAQRQIVQFNEYFYQAENAYVGSRYSLTRVRLDRVDIVPDGTIGFGNNPFGGDMTPDLEWGFPAYDPIYTVNNPEFLVTEWTLLHEVGHHMGRHHNDLGARWLTPGVTEILDPTSGAAFAQRWNQHYHGDGRLTPFVMQNTGYDRGWGPYSTWGFFYEFQNKPGRQVPERMGSQNAGNGRLAPVPTSEPHYWNVYYSNPSVWPYGLPDYSGNNYWIHLAQPSPTRLLVPGPGGRPLAGASVEVFRSDPVPVEQQLPSSDETYAARWTGYIRIDVPGTYEFAVVTISRAYFGLTVNGITVIPANTFSYVDQNEYLDQHYAVSLPSGRVPFTFEMHTAEGGAIHNQFGLLMRPPGASLPRPLLESELSRDLAGTQPGVNVSFFHNEDFTAPWFNRIDPRLFYTHYRFDGIPDFVGQTGATGIVDMGTVQPIAPSDRKLNQRDHLAIARITYNGQQYIKMIDITHLNIAYWRDPVHSLAIVLDTDDDGGHSYIPATCIAEDLNCDCAINLTDIMMAVDRWQHTPLDPDYASAFDYDGNDQIDVVDVMRTASAWGMECAAEMVSQGE